MPASRRSLVQEKSHPRSGFLPVRTKVGKAEFTGGGGRLWIEPCCRSPVRVAPIDRDFHRILKA